MIQNIMLQFNFLQLKRTIFKCMKLESELPLFVWSRSRLRDLRFPEPEPVPDPPKKSGGSTTLLLTELKYLACFNNLKG